MPAEATLVRSLLKDVALEGALVIEKRKLLWLLGWGQDRGGAWEELLTYWREIGQDKDALHGFEAHGKIVLTLKAPKAVLEPVANWV